MGGLPVLFVVAATVLGAMTLWSLEGALTAVVVAGFVQDPLRKMVIGQPALFVALSLAVFGVVTVRWVLPAVPDLLARREHLARIGRPLGYFLSVLAVLTLRFLLSDGRPIVAILGVLSYTGPLLAVAAGYRLADRERSATRFLRFYALLGLTSSASVLLEYSGVRARWLGAVGEGMWVYGVGIGLSLPSGILRTSEVAAWHGGTTACVLLTLAVARRGSWWLRNSYLTGGLLLLALGGTFVTGRRKALFTVGIFLLVFLFILLRDRWGRRRKRALWTLVSVGVAAFALAVMAPVESDARSDALVYRGGQVTEPLDRIRETLAGVPRLVEEFGIFGVGPGQAAQGVQYLGGLGKLEMKAEAGLLRVVAEIGIVGLAAGMLLVLELARILVARLRASPSGAADGTLRAGVIGILAGNAFSAATAGQIFGDPFVYLFLGILFGIGLGPLTSPRHEEGVATGMTNEAVRSL